MFANSILCLSAILGATLCQFNSENPYGANKQSSSQYNPGPMFNQHSMQSNYPQGAANTQPSNPQFQQQPPQQNPSPFMSTFPQQQQQQLPFYQGSSSPMFPYYQNPQSQPFPTAYPQYPLNQGLQSPPSSADRSQRSPTSCPSMESPFSTAQQPGTSTSPLPPPFSGLPSSPMRVNPFQSSQQPSPLTPPMPPMLAIGSALMARTSSKHAGGLPKLPGGFKFPF